MIYDLDTLASEVLPTKPRFSQLAKRHTHLMT